MRSHRHGDWTRLNTPALGPKYTGPEGGFHPVFSNFTPSPIVHRGLWYPTVEHFYQAQKTTSRQRRYHIRNARSPGHAKVLGRFAPLRPDWEEVKYEVMLTGLRLKFWRPSLAWTLMNFSGPIVEWNSWHDRIWGVCTCRRCRSTGLNLLGSALEQVRSELLAAYEPLEALS